MKLMSWNVNGLRSALKKGFQEFVEAEQPDMLCLQETKAEPNQVNLNWVHDLGYQDFWCNAEKKGYSGTTIWTRVAPESSSQGIGIAEHDTEGRVVTATFDKFHLVNVYTPNSKRGLTRLDYRQTWDAEFLAHVKKLNQDRPVIFCGDLNCAHKEIDLANPKGNKRNAGFSPEERGGIDNMNDAGFVDTFREFDQGPGNYTWWTVFTNARERNIGWRLDYFFVSDSLMPQVKNSRILASVLGSDHCPVELTLK